MAGHRQEAVSKDGSHTRVCAYALVLNTVAPPFSAMATAFASLKSNLNTYRRGCNWQLNQHFLSIYFLSSVLASQSSSHLRTTAVSLFPFSVVYELFSHRGHQSTWMKIHNNRNTSGFRSVCNWDGERVSWRLEAETRDRKWPGHVLARICSHPFSHWSPCFC